MNVLDLKKQLVDVCHRASERWLTAGSGGNISVRIPNSDRYLCTATGVTFRDTAVDNIVEMDLEGRSAAATSSLPRSIAGTPASSPCAPRSTASCTPTRP